VPPSRATPVRLAQHPLPKRSFSTTHGKVPTPTWSTTVVVISVQRKISNKVPRQDWLVPGNWKDFPPTGNFLDQDDYISGALEVSSGHPVSRLGKTSQDIGGDFRVKKREHEASSSLGDAPMHFSEWHDWGNPYHADPMADGITHTFHRPRCVKGQVTQSSFWADSGENGAVPSSFLSLDGYGTTAISKIIPTTPLFDAATQLGELREGFPRHNVHTWRDRTAVARNAGNNYLAYQFGWAPLISEMRSFFKTVRDFDEIKKKYEEGSGKLLRRRYDWVPTFDFYQSSDTGYSGYLPTGSDGALMRPDHVGRMTRVRRYKQRRWLEACFTYHLPKQGTWQRELALVNHAFGVIPSPETVWELTPWSWAIDWFTNTGDIMKNLHGFLTDGLVMPYAYIMEETSVSWEYSLTGVAYKSYAGMQTFTQSFSETVKQRRAATPFGFGFDLSTLNERQLAIVAALGLGKT
jgi:hypothetical protein